MNVKKDLIKKSGKPSPLFLKDNLLKTGTYLNVYDYKKLSKVSIPIFLNIERSPFCKRKKTERTAEGLALSFFQSTHKSTNTLSRKVNCTHFLRVIFFIEKRKKYPIFPSVSLIE
ncbi:hypothetical protein C6371_17705 [Bacillus atrophaeus]|nr:hypothetical protein C6371_17705 [Bacillus atrophaeus]